MTDVGRTNAAALVSWRRATTSWRDMGLITTSFASRERRGAMSEADTSFKVALEPPPKPAVISYGPSGEVYSELPDPPRASRHLQALSTLPSSAFLAYDQPEKEDAGGASSAAAAATMRDETMSTMSENVAVSAAAANMPALLGHLRAAASEADQLARLFGAVRGGKQVKAEQRVLLPSAPFPPPRPASMTEMLVTSQLESAAATLRRGAAVLRETSARATRAEAEARALRSHWKLAALDGASSASGSHALRLCLAPHDAGDGEDEADALAAHEIELRSDARGSLVLPQEVAGERLAVVRVRDGSEEEAAAASAAVRATLPFLDGAGAPSEQPQGGGGSSEDGGGGGSSEDNDVKLMEVDEGDGGGGGGEGGGDDDAGGGGGVSATVSRTHKALLASQFGVDMSGVFQRVSYEVQQPHHASKVLRAQTRSAVLDCPHAPSLCIELGLEEVEQQQQPSGEPTAVGLGAIEIGMLSRSSRDLSVVDFAVEASTLRAQQRKLRQLLDDLAASTSDPTLRTYWHYSPSGNRETGQLAASLELHILCRGAHATPGTPPTITSAVAALLQHNGHVHAQHVAGVAASTEGAHVFPFEAIVSVGSAEDGVTAFGAAVRAALGKTLLLRLREAAEALGLAVESLRLGSAIRIQPKASSSGSPPPWLEVSYIAAALSSPVSTPLVDVLLCTSKQAAGAPTKVDLQTLKARHGGGLCAKLEVLLVQTFL